MMPISASRHSPRQDVLSVFFEQCAVSAKTKDGKLSDPERVVVSVAPSEAV